METAISLGELAMNLAAVLDRVRHRREHFVVEQDGEPVACLGPVSAPPGITPRALLAQLGDLSLPGEGFADDLEAVQSTQARVEFPTWPS